MKIFATFFLLISALLSAGSAAAQQPQQISVKVHNQAAARGGLKVRFVELVEDSRCAVDVDCVWAGNAKIKVRVTRNGKAKILELNTNEGTPPVFAGYRFTLEKLTPELRSNVRINPNEYVASIRIAKAK